MSVAIIFNGSFHKKTQPTFFISEAGFNQFTVLVSSMNLYTTHTFPKPAYSTVTDFARLRGWSTSVPRKTATW